MSNSFITAQNPAYRWIPTLYFVEGLPYTLAMLVSSIFYQNFGLSNTRNAFFTGLLILPWSLKPLISPFLEIFATKKYITVMMEIVMGSLCLLLACSMFASHWFLFSFILFLTLALVSATHDITADGLYLACLNATEQANYIGLRSAFYQLARWTANGLAVMGVGLLTTSLGLHLAWALFFLFAAGLFLLFAKYHQYYLPVVPRTVVFTQSKKDIFLGFKNILKAFIQLPHIVFISIFLFFYNFPEGQLLKIVPLFLLDTVSHGGLHFSTTEVGFIYGSIGVMGMIVGVFLGGALMGRFAQRDVLIALTLFPIVSNLGYFLLVFPLSLSLWWVAGIIFFAQLAFGASTSAYLIYMMRLFSGKAFSMTFYAIGTALMALGFTASGMISGYVQEKLGYSGFLVEVILLGVLVLFYTILLLNKTGFSRETRCKEAGVYR